MSRSHLRTIAIATVLGCQALPSRAQEDGVKIGQALSMISGFARDMCVTVSPDSSSNSLELAGEAKAKLDLVIAKIADLGLGGSVKYTDSSSKGVLQRDLSQAYKDSNDCRLRVLDTLIVKLLPTDMPDTGQMRLSGLWYPKDDKLGMISVVVKGRSFHSTEFTSGKATASIDGTVQGDLVEGIAYLEPDPSSTIKISERTEFGAVQMRLSADGQRLVGIFTINVRPPAVARAVSFEWTRAQ